MNPHNGTARELMFAIFGRDDPERHWREAMGVEWIDIFTAREAIPPAYTEHIGAMLLEHLAVTA